MRSVKWWLTLRYNQLRPQRRAGLTAAAQQYQGDYAGLLVWFSYRPELRSWIGRCLLAIAPGRGSFPLSQELRRVYMGEMRERGLVCGFIGGQMRAVDVCLPVQLPTRPQHALRDYSPLPFEATPPIQRDASKMILRSTDF